MAFLENPDKPWPVWYYCTDLLIDAFNMAACLAVIRKIHRKRRLSRGSGGSVHTASGGMPQLIEDLVLLLASYNLLYNIVFGVGVDVAYLLPPDSPLGARATDLFDFGIPFTWPPVFFHTYIASICHKWLVLGYSVARIRRGFRPAMCWMATAFAVQAFLEVNVFLVSKWVPLWAPFTAVERLVGMIVTTAMTAFFYLRACWTILVRFRARERVKRRHVGMVKRFILTMNVVIVANALWTAYLYMWYNQLNTGVLPGLLIFPILSMPIYDAVVLGNLLQGWCTPCRPCNRDGGAAAGDQEDSAPAQPPALAGRRPASRNLSSVKYLSSFLGGRSNSSSYSSGPRSGTDSLVANSASLFVSTFNTGPIKDVGGLGGKLADWVPQGYDVYAIGLQECSFVDELRHALHEHLGGPAVYQIFQAQVAPASLLYGSIALTVFARAADVASGAFAAVGAETSAVRNGVHLVLGRAGNKGMTGLSFRMHDATLAFVTCHYASDSGGKRRLRQRHADARRTLGEVRLTDDEGFHVAAQHHHTFVFGDMNYRMRLPAEQMVQRIAATARSLEASVWQDEHASQFEEAEGAGESDDEPLSSKDEESGLPPRPAMRSWVANAYRKLFRQDPNALSYSSSNSGPSVESKIKGEGVGASDDYDDYEEEEGKASDDDIVAAVADSLFLPTASELGSRAAGEAGRPVEAQQWRSGVWYGHLFRWVSRGARFLSSSETEGGAHSSGGVFSSYTSSVSQASGANITSYSAKRTCEGLWGWVADHDELLLEMRAGHVFAGFSEGPITFPPPFRWRRGGDAGDYTSEDRLRNAYVLRKKGDGERVPSYTDRILFHSLPDMRSQLHLLAYQMCDALRGSDHRPMSAAFRLLVDRERIGFHAAAAGAAAAGSTPSITSTWQLQLSQPFYQAFRLRPSLAEQDVQPSWSFPLRGRDTTTQQSLAQGPLLPEPGWLVTVFFPCVLEDPYADDIKVHALEEALCEGTAGTWGASHLSRCSSGSGRNAGGSFDDKEMAASIGVATTPEALRRSHSFTWRELTQAEGVVFSALVHPEVSRHALIQLVDGKGVEVGQGVICLRHAFLGSSIGQEGSMREVCARGRFILPRLLVGDGRRAKAGGTVLEEGVKVLLSCAGQAVGTLSLHVKIRRHKS